MAAMNSCVLTSSYAVSGASDANFKLKSSVPSSVRAARKTSGSPKLAIIRAQQASTSTPGEAKVNGRRAALLCLGVGLFTTAASSVSQANAGIVEDLLEKTKTNKELNDKKRLATSGANFARAYTVEFGSCKFPENFTGCQDLAKTKKVQFLSDDIDLECEGKDAGKCGSSMFYKK
ncbi:Photosystem I reaction center subunit N [Zostera marina]|uniref:Photosystem I reaction center subunit N, chloroplastic n=1 Tax=Zostera marina TaxID=29655 RepID=A0A0K9P5U6_ZOSMR|nr:Photosystem I reaction center subunit N [Zostera marina]